MSDWIDGSQLRFAQMNGERIWGHLGRGRAWHMYPNDPEKSYWKLEWPDGVVRGKGKTLTEAFKNAGHPIPDSEQQGRV